IAPTRYGYSFVGWYDNKDFNGIPITEINSDVTRDITVYARWSPKKYTYTINPNNGVINISSIEVTYGEKIPLSDLSARIYRNGYRLVGWNLSILDTDYDLTNDSVVNVEGEGVLNPIWSEGQFNIAFQSGIANDNNTYQSKVVTKGEQYGELPTITREGYTFVGWSYKNGDDVVIVKQDSIVNLDKDTVLTAVFSKNSDDIEITIEKGDLSDVSTFAALEKEVPEQKTTANPWFISNATGAYYNQLNSEGKKLYTGLYEVYANGDNINKQLSFEMKSSLDLEAFAAALTSATQGFIYDHVELTWIQSGKFKIMGIDGGYKMTFTPINPYSYDLCITAVNAVVKTKGYTDILNGTGITSEDTTAQKVYKIEKLISKYMKYGILDENTNNCSNEFRDPAYSLFVNSGYGVCASYAKLFKIICNYYGIECSYVIGKYDAQRTVSGHAWNYVKVEDKWYLLDVTGDCTEAEDNLMKFLLGTNESSGFNEENASNNLISKSLNLSSTKYIQGFNINGFTYETPELWNTEADIVSLDNVSTVKKIIIPNTVKHGSFTYNVEFVDKTVFTKAKKVKKIVIGKNIYEIKNGSFKKCKVLKKIVIKSKNLKITKKAFGKKQKLTIKVPKAKKKKYKKMLKKYKGITIK
ncbi:MAG: InlB B-repeat-containing protein, partial [Lachnospiraceae bacterium]|nr:InlB B-repeat-containing protein [Lachnospiraceae bacterium]